MLLACLIAVASVFVGAALGLSKRAGPDVLGPVRTFAFAAAATVVVAVFVPEAMETLGALALAPFAAGFVAPLALERLTARSTRRSSSQGAALEVGFIGLVVHQLGDGLGMGSFTGPAHAGHSHLDVFLAVGGHTVPIAALVVLAFAEQKGRGVALRRASGLALSVVVGVLVARFTGVSLESSVWGGVLSGVVGGLLLHIATHDMNDALPRTHASRAIDFAAACAGVLVVVAGGHGHEHGVHPSGEHASAVDVVLALSLRAAPFLLLAIAFAAARPARAVGRLDAPGLVGAAIAAAVLPLSLALPLGIALGAMALVWPRSTNAPGAERVSVIHPRLGAAGDVGLFGAIGAAIAGCAWVAFADAPVDTTPRQLAATSLVVLAGVVHPVAAALPAACMVRLGVPTPFVVGGVVAGAAARGFLDHARSAGPVRAVGRIRAALAGAAAVLALALLVVLPSTPTAIVLPDVIGWIALAGSAAIVLVAAFLIGTRGLFAGLVGPSSSKPGCADDDHGHVHWDHAHAHAHAHAHPEATR